MHFGDELATLSWAQPSAVDMHAHLSGFLADQGFQEGSNELDRSPQLRCPDVLACVPPRASSRVLCDVGPTRAWRPHAGEARLSRTTRGDGFLVDFDTVREHLTPSSFSVSKKKERGSLSSPSGAVMCGHVRLLCGGGGRWVCSRLRVAQCFEIF